MANKSLDGMVTPTDKKTATTKNSAWTRIAWVGMLFVILSIGFSSYMVYFGSDNTVAKFMLIPQVVFAAGVAIYRFSK